MNFIFLCIKMDIYIKKRFQMLSTELKFYYAVVAELVDARVLGTRIFGCGSSSLPDRIKSFDETHRRYFLKFLLILKRYLK